MRQGQNNKRSRGRPNNRKPQSGRTFDSNGPDVKIRGTAAHIYEKYQSLARDAQASGDRIVAENYLQHAEHYFRVMLAAEGPAALQNRMNGGQQRPGQPGGSGQHGDMGEDGEQPAVAASNGQSHHTNDQQPSAHGAASDEVDHQEHHGNGHSNGRSASHTDEPVVVQANGPAADASSNTEAAAPEQAPAREAGNGREQPRRRGRPPRDREEVSAAPATEAEAGSETSESAN